MFTFNNAKLLVRLGARYRRVRLCIRSICNNVWRQDLHLYFNVDAVYQPASHSDLSAADQALQHLNYL